jgi:hypothetical protein
MPKAKFEIYGYGGEIVVGNVSRETIEYFGDNEIWIEDYAAESETTVPEELQPFSPGSWFECDNIAHCYGPEMEDGTTITVTNEEGDEVWEHSADQNELADNGVTVADGESVDLDDEDYKGGCYYVGTSGEKGTLFSGEFELAGEFDPAKLKISVNRICGWEIVGTVEYDGVEIENTDMDSTGKSSSHEFIEV